MINSGSQQKVLMLGASRLQVPAILAAKNLGFEVICADYDPNAVGFKVADRHFLTSTLDIEGIEKLALAEGVSFVITSTSDAPVKIAALVSERLDLPTGISSHNAICATEKDAMRLRLDHNNIPMPDYRICHNFQEFQKAVGNFGYDCIVKPADSAASRGVRLLTPADKAIDPESLFDEILAFSTKGVVMVEERLIGKEVSVEAMTVNGVTSILAITDKLTTDPPFFVELGHSEPSLHSLDIQHKISEMTKDVVSAIGLINGPSHTEIMITEDGPKVIETAARLGGDFITSKLVPLSTGIDFVAGSVAVAVGQEYDFTPNRLCGCAIRFITANKAGTIEAINISEDVSSFSGVEELSFYLAKGDMINTPHSSGDRIGHVICTGRDASEAVIRAEAVINAITVEIS